MMNFRRLTGQQNMQLLLFRLPETVSEFVKPGLILLQILVK
jgi:hypothetical protein